MSTVAVQREIRQWLDVVRSQLHQISVRLRNDADPVELTADGEAAHLFLLQVRDTLENGSTILGDEVRRALDVFMLDSRRAFRPRSTFLTDPQPDPSSYYQEVEIELSQPSDRPHAIPSGGQASGPSDPG